MLSSVLGAEGTVVKTKSICLSVYLPMIFSLEFSGSQLQPSSESPLPLITTQISVQIPHSQEFLIQQVGRRPPNFAFPKTFWVVLMLFIQEPHSENLQVSGTSPSFCIDSVVLLYCQCLEYIWTEQKTKYKVFCFDKGE